MSTYAIGHIVNQLCKRLSENQIYLNIGCWKGFTLVSGMIDTNCKVIGVDNFSQFEGPKKDFYSNLSCIYGNIDLDCHAESESGKWSFTSPPPKQGQFFRGCIYFLGYIKKFW